MKQQRNSWLYQIKLFCVYHLKCLCTTHRSCRLSLPRHLQSRSSYTPKLITHLPWHSILCSCSYTQDIDLQVAVRGANQRSQDSSIRPPATIKDQTSRACNIGTVKHVSKNITPSTHYLSSPISKSKRTSWRPDKHSTTWIPISARCSHATSATRTGPQLTRRLFLSCRYLRGTRGQTMRRQPTINTSNISSYLLSHLTSLSLSFGMRLR